jgi:co-chaperonin GroES (HSP10)
MPKPAGFHILCAIPKAKESFEASVLIKAAKTMADEEAATTVLFVLDLGPDAYGDKARFPSGPWCKKGDYIVVRTYSGTRFKIFGQEFRILNDDQVEAVVDDPRGILRVQA